MNVKDIQNAVMFMVTGGYKHIYMQCKTARDIPLVKRELIALLGMPSKMIDNTFYYNRMLGHDHSITIVPLSKELRGVDEQRVFYIAYKDNTDWNELCIERGVKQPLVPYMRMPCIGIADVYTWMVRDGYKPAEAVHRLRCDGWLD